MPEIDLALALSADGLDRTQVGLVDPAFDGFLCWGTSTARVLAGYTCTSEEPLGTQPVALRTRRQDRAPNRSCNR